MGEYADMEIEAGIYDWGVRGEDDDEDCDECVPASAWAPKGSWYCIGELLEDKETERAWCIRLIKKGVVGPYVYVPKSRAELAEDKKSIWMPYWLATAKAKETREKQECA